MPPRSGWLMTLCSFVGMSLLLLVVGAAPPAAHAEPPPVAPTPPPPVAADLLECAERISYDQVMSCALQIGGEVDQIQFEAQAGDVVNIHAGRTSGTLVPQIALLDGDGTALCTSSNRYNVSTFTPPCVINETGTYIIQISDVNNTGTGSYNVFLRNQIRPTNPTPIVLGSGMTDLISVAIQQKAYTVTVADNALLMFRVTAVTAGFRPSILVGDDDETFLCIGTNRNYATEEVTCRFPFAGTYTVYVGDSGLETTGTYQLFAQNILEPVGAEPLPQNSLTTGIMPQAAALVSHRVTVVGNTHLIFRMARTSGSILPNFRIYNHDGTLLCNQYSSREYHETSCYFPLGGTYTMLINDYYNTNVGSYNLTVFNAAAPGAVPPAAIGSTIAGIIPVKTSVEAYTLTVRSGEILRLRAATTSGNLVPFIRVIGRDGQVCAAAYNYSAEVAACTFALGGTYTLLITDFHGTGTGSYALAIQSIINPVGADVLTANSAVTDTLYVPQINTYHWYGKGGDSLKLTMSLLTGSLRPMLQVYDDLGILICSAYANYGYDTASIDPCFLPRNARYTIIAYSYSIANTGSYRLTLTCNNDECGAPIPTSTPTPLPTATPSATREPTATPADTAAPSSTPEPSATAVTPSPSSTAATPSPSTTAATPSTTAEATATATTPSPSSTAVTPTPSSTPEPTATAPTDPQVPQLSVAPGANSLLLTWTPPRDTRVADYLISRRTAETAFTTVAIISETTYIDADPTLEAGVTYCYQITPRTNTARTLTSSAIVCSAIGLVELWVPDVWARPGDTVIVPVNIRNAHGLRIAATDLWLEFDGTVITPSGIRSTALTNAYVWRYAVDVYDTTYRRVKISSIASPAPMLYGNGSLFWLTFNVVGTPGQRSSLNLRDYITGVGGSNMYAVAADGDLVEVTLRLHSGTLEIGAAHSLGDVDGNGTVGAVDAYLTLQLASGQRTPAPAEQVAADVNGDGRIGAADATLILFYAVNNRWPTVAEEVVLSDDTPVTLAVEAVRGVPGQVVSSTLRLDHAAVFAGADLTLLYDSAVIAEVRAVRLVQAGQEFALAFHDTGAGAVQVALARAEATTLNGALLSLEVVIAETATVGQQAALTLADARLNDAAGRDFATSALQQRITRSHGSVAVVDPQTVQRIYLPLVVRGQ